MGEIVLLVAVVWSYSLGAGIGILVTIVWLLLGAGMISLLGIDFEQPTHGEKKKEKSHYHSLVGRSGLSVSTLNPTGIVEVEKKRIEARLFRGFIQSGTRIKVTGVKNEVVEVVEE